MPYTPLPSSDPYRLAPHAPLPHPPQLDPDATGVLAIGVGKGTKQLGSLLAGDKAYEATGRLGAATDTLDASGTIVAQRAFSHVARGTLEDALLERFTGHITQVPPMYSALKVDGRRLHELAREGKVVEREPRPVHVKAVELLAFDPPEFRIRVVCGGGFYIRSLIADLADAVDTCAHTTKIERIAQGKNAKATKAAKVTILLCRRSIPHDAH